MCRKLGKRTKDIWSEFYRQVGFDEPIPKTYSDRVFKHLCTEYQLGRFNKTFTRALEQHYNKISYGLYSFKYLRKMLLMITRSKSGD